MSYPADETAVRQSSRARLRREFVRVTFTSSDNANKLSPVLITSQTSVDQAGLDSFKYLLQPNLLLR